MPRNLYKIFNVYPILIAMTFCHTNLGKAAMVEVIITKREGA